MARPASRSSGTISCAAAVRGELAEGLPLISKRLAAEIRRLAEVEGWRSNTIARHLGVHHSTVTRVLERAGLAPPVARPRSSMLDRYVAYVHDVFERYPKLSASVVYEMVKARGYPGGPDHFRHRVAELGLRPRRVREAFFELRTLPGEQAQVDWAHFGTRRVAGGERRLNAFVMVLSYSRALYVRFFYDARLSSFLAAHVEAFSRFGGCAKCLLYDNLKSVVLERKGSAIRFHPRLLEIADHYGFDPRPVAPRRGNEKGRVERAIRYLRSSFFPLRSTWSLEALNRDALVWCRERTMQRPWPQDRRRTVEQAWLEERSDLLSLPDEPFPCHEWVETIARRTPYVTFDTNRYSIPPEHVGRSLTIAAEIERLRLFDGTELIAEHARSWDKGQVIEDPRHLEELRQQKRAARRHRGQHHLIQAVPQAEELLRLLAQRQRRLAGAVARLIELLAEAGPRELAAAVAEAVERGTPDPETVRLILDRRRHERGLRPALPVKLPGDPRIRDLVVTPHSLADYDVSDDEEETER